MAEPLPISFLTDYGLQDEFVAVCKGVMLQIVADARVLDVTHDIEPGNIRAGALAYLRAIQYLPVGVHLGVVDPGVGTDRRAIALRSVDESGTRYFVGPDNGVLSPALAICGGACEAVLLDPSRWGVERTNTTFHGRDVFAPAAGALAGGVSLAELGTPVSPSELVPLILPLSRLVEETIHGMIFWVDRFGNAQTNIPGEDLAVLGVEVGMELLVQMGEARQRFPFVETFGDIEKGQPLAYVDSSGQLAFAVHRGNAAEEFALQEGAAVAVASAPLRLL